MSGEEKEPNSQRHDMIFQAFDEALEEEGFKPEGYTDLVELDRGGMSMIYLAQQIEPQREVALKIVLPKYAEDENIRERFQREGQAMANLDHPGILPVYQVGEWDGLSFIAIKLATGGSLQDMLDQEGALTPELAVDWLIAVGEAIHYAHQSGVLHRDLKPANLLFDHNGAIYVSDFGVAKMDLHQGQNLTMTNAVIGTPHYLAPEVASGKNQGGSVATDLYGLGAILYRCLTGKIPHKTEENLASQLRVIIEEDIVSVKQQAPDIPRDLCVICEKALAKEPDDRYRSVLDFVEDLKRLKSGLPIEARPATIVEKYWLWTKRYPLASVLSILLVVTLITSTALFISNYKKRGELLYESLLERAKAERLVQEPMFRDRAIDLLSSAQKIKKSEKIREEALAVLSYWDISEQKENASFWAEEGTPSTYRVEEGEGVFVLKDLQNNMVKKIPFDGALRCPPAISPDGRFLAFVRGAQIEIVIYNVLEDVFFSTIPVEDWPQSLHFSLSGEVIKSVFENTKASLFSLRGDTLLTNFNENDTLREPVGLSLWKGHFIHSRQAKPYGGEISPQHQYIATTSVIGVHIWNTQSREAVDFHEVENQRIDAPTDAWWLDDRRLLVQVPGAQEILEINSTGEITKVIQNRRVPGTVVNDIFPNGDWLVEVKNEEGDSHVEIWMQGDSERTREWTPVYKRSPLSHKDGIVRYEDWTLTLPSSDQILKVFMLEDGKRIVALTTDYDIYEWDLVALEKELVRLGFSRTKTSN